MSAGPLPTTEEGWAARNLTLRLFHRGRHGLSRSQQLSTSKWIASQDSETSLLVQIGANSHRKAAGPHLLHSHSVHTFH